MPTFTIRTELAVTPEAFWRRMSMNAVNAELRPLVSMTAPAAWRNCPVEQWAAGPVLFRSVILLFGLIPVDVHSLRLAQIIPARGFLERSHSWCNKVWQHERTTERSDAGCVVTDTLTVQGRIPFLAALLMPMYRAVFRHRHHRLKAMYGHVPFEP
ncbi:hypothetical protein [Pseudoduganella violaceinigra]|uniref:hypothetical protein n=1 Tax=Pseudoduganella violaceinigra TaxID=246602 RepID=UPI000409D94C|nr:hypothetical protein [Pseudoduganella violaceinigra]